MKCRFKANNPLTATKETGHTITTAEVRIIHKKLASYPLKIQASKKSDEPSGDNLPADAADAGGSVTASTVTPTDNSWPRMNQPPVEARLSS